MISKNTHILAFIFGKIYFKNAVLAHSPYQSPYNTSYSKREMWLLSLRKIKHNTDQVLGT